MCIPKVSKHNTVFKSLFEEIYFNFDNGETRGCQHISEIFLGHIFFLVSYTNLL